MKGIIIYNTKTGTTKKYAQWIKEETNFDLISLKEAVIDNISKYDVVVYGSRVVGSKIDLSFIKKNKEKLQNKKIFVYAVGAFLIENDEISSMYDLNFKGLPKTNFYFFRGKWDIEDMNYFEKKICKMLEKYYLKKDLSSISKKEREFVEILGKSNDWSSKEQIIELIKDIK